MFSQVVQCTIILPHLGYQFRSPFNRYISTVLYTYSRVYNNPEAISFWRHNAGLMKMIPWQVNQLWVLNVSSQNKKIRGKFRARAKATLLTAAGSKHLPSWVTAQLLIVSGSKHLRSGLGLRLSCLLSQDLNNSRVGYRVKAQLLIVTGSKHLQSRLGFKAQLLIAAGSKHFRSRLGLMFSCWLLQDLKFSGSSLIDQLNAVCS